ncbi:tRNA (guanosine(46)-N7)-methyltransferase TrmB [Gracilibacillus dipsosauri]|uniref:tRNA (guanine-N(7)-)-methyltransferase n=1 Tax=Gracilibacillus dipsosauri TaxID=178340 RepID=A0A317L426_9BACI|nr:tRNA (guanosine(46)-N7)-methyltransferase TrmB [Gracilibacillus dipsosauri]PWU70253.1 tRNA (guanosine(46)-N7)-methyltransferase TrmB [Gracilibacillus dipsosauri]
MRARHKPWADEYLNKNKDIIEPEPKQFKGNWKSLFESEKPIHLEIGTGKGQFIVGMAKQYPEINFIGLEVVKSIIVSAVEKVKETDIHNVRLLNENAENLSELFAEGEIDTLYLNFSDPWPKNRHEKRRLTFPAFLEQYKAIMKKSGQIILKTDNRGLFEYSLTSFSKFGFVLEDVTLDLHAEDDPNNIKTEYEEKFSAKGLPIYRCVAKLKS